MTREPEVVRPYRCEECGDRLSFDTAVVAFMQWGDPILATIAHEDCAPPLAYHVGFDRLLSCGLEGPNGWREHLSRKTWITLDAIKVLEMAHEMAKDLKRREDESDARPLSLMRPVSASIPRRRPRTPDNPRNIPTGTRTRVLERDGFKCRRCGCGPSDAQLVVDHIVPVAKGGTAAFENLQTLCRPCNAGKSDREPTAHDLRDQVRP
jgi:5-methylcytosine-specific restriction endonuclease McrA